MAPSVIGFTLKRSPMVSHFLHFLLVVSCTLVVASCGEARMSAGGFMTERSLEVKMGVASNRRELAGTNITTLNSTTNLSEDADVLLLFKAAITFDPFNVTRYWKPIGKRQLINPCRPWKGIKCTKRRVTSIELYNQSLGGTLPAVLGRLSALRTLNLSTNQFSGPIPSELGLASSLEVLDFGSNNLNGSLPSSLGDLTNLTSLVVSNNGFVGAVPTSIGNLQRIRNLNISGNNLSGAFPTELTNLLALEALDLGNNNVSGAIPVGIGSLANLTVLDARNNMFIGGLPATLGDCISLTRLDVSGNPQLYGSIPSTLGQLTRLETLRLAGSNLTGTIPQALTDCAGLKDIDLSNNALHGNIPFQNLKNLTVLHLQNNLLEGDFISRVPTFSVLEDLDLTNNLLNGSIPEGIAGVPFQKGLLLGQNLLNGIIPNGLGDLALVERIDLSANRFSGGIPDALRNCISLTELHVGNNALTGGFSVPNGTMPGLTMVNISYNLLNGTLPTLNHLANLKVFDGSFNSFSGGIPSTFVNFASLQLLNVSSNHLSGEVPFFTIHDNVTERSFVNNTDLCGKVLNKGCGNGKLATSTIVYIALGSAAGLVVLISVILFLVYRRKGWNKGSKHSAQVSAELQLKVAPEEILAATNGFNDASYIGEGKLSVVYRGLLPDQTVVAVKRLAISKATVTEDAEKALNAELEVLGHIRHRSLVKVLGYCSSPEAKALVLEYMPHGSLAGLLHSPQNEEVNRAFDWTIRFKIAVEIAEGLKYLHAECRNPVVHGDVKPSNILFDANMEARVADFGVKRILAEQGFSSTSSSSTPVTTAHGYTPSEVAASGVPSLKGDVYSFGIIMLEMITGRDPNQLEPGQTLPQWVRATVANSKALQNVLDPVLMQDITAHQQKMAMVLGVALLCTRSEPQDRPQMNDVYKMLAHIRSKPNESSRRKGLMSSGRRTLSVARRSAREVQVVQQPLPHTPSLSDWTPPSQV
ncbi:hypothetical protein KC19_1G190200 [Ceratodon purpureus]|uniref:non-specific serine/threonine protein kinase n=1 Tax=Ceratodon purpureus TaxID=3225 RepID=A0A8T0J8R9_CERPU|nr:hypothetical protein KC19_1G190200 [Ceratodon purpureus]